MHYYIGRHGKRGGYCVRYHKRCNTGKDRNFLPLDVPNALRCRQRSYDERTAEVYGISGYDGHYKDSVQEIMDKFTSDKYADQRNEIEGHRKEKDYLYFLPVVAKLLRMTEGTLRRRPTDIQLSLCKRYTDNWYCDTYTIQHELRDALMLITKPELTDSDKEKAVGKD